MTKRFIPNRSQLDTEKSFHLLKSCENLNNEKHCDGSKEKNDDNPINAEEIKRRLFLEPCPTQQKIININKKNELMQTTSSTAYSTSLFVASCFNDQFIDRINKSLKSLKPTVKRMVTLTANMCLDAPNVNNDFCNYF